MRTIVLSILICGILLFGWNQLVKRKLSGMKTNGAASQFDQNVMKAQSFVYTRWQPKVVIAGSSIAARLTSHPKEWYNLAFAGGSAFTALEIITESGKKPDLVLIETNVLTVPEDRRLLNSLFFPGLSKLRDRYPGLREQYKPSHVVVTSLPEPKNEAATQGLGPERFGEQVKRRLTELQEAPKAGELDAIVEKLRGYVRRLQERGIRVAFFEMPEYEQGGQLPKPAAVRSRLKEAFPESEFAWVPRVNAAEFQTTDAVHLDQASAKRYGSIMAEYVQSLVPAPASQPAGETAVVNLNGD